MEAVLAFTTTDGCGIFEAILREYDGGAEEVVAVSVHPIEEGED